jgi:hypothetical protein
VAEAFLGDLQIAGHAFSIDQADSEEVLTQRKPILHDRKFPNPDIISGNPTA